MSSQTEEPRQDAAHSAQDPAVTREVTAWISLLVRTVKTCRLYDAANPTVAKFRQELVEATERLLDRCGALRLAMQSSAMVWEDQPVFESTSRDDNLAGVFHRDGVRSLTFLPGITGGEVNSFLDVVLNVTAPSPGDDDLVTLLWEANLPHVEVAAVPLEGDIDGGGEEGLAEDAPGMPWPGSAAGDATASAPGSAAGPTPDDTRSDDWHSVDGAADPETVFEELDATSAAHLEAFGNAAREAHARPLVTSVAEILADALSSGATAEDRAALAPFVPRLMREAIGQGVWSTAEEALRLLRECAPDHPLGDFFEGIRTESSPVTHHAVAALDRQGEDELEAFAGFVAAIGPPAANWVMAILAESQQRRVRQRLVEVLAQLAADSPSTLLPWLSDSRWYVVRNVVHVFSRIGGDATGGFVKAVLEHPDPRVRREVIEVLGQTEPALARPMLAAMLDVSEPRLYASIMQKLAQDGAPEVTALLLAAFEHERFSRRSDEEQRAILKALATRGDVVLPALEAELHRGGLFSRGDEPIRQSIARCVARIGTPAARELLDRGARSGKPGIRKACALALQAGGGRDA